MPDLSIVSDELHKDFTEAVSMASAAGIRRFELRHLTTGRVPSCSRKELQTCLQVVNDCNLTITALSPGLFKHTATEAGFLHELREVLPRAIDLAREFGVEKVLIFGFAKGQGDAAEERRQAIDWLQQAAAIAAESGVRLLLEPEPICRADTGLHAAELVRGVSNASLEMNYDPGNVAWMAGADPSPEVASIASSIAHLHLKDIDVDSPPDAPRWVMIGHGIVNYPGIFKLLVEHQYQGEIALEPHMPGIDRVTLAAYARRVLSLWHDAGSGIAEAETWNEFSEAK